MRATSPSISSAKATPRRARTPPGGVVGAQTRSAILDVAERICAREGFEGLSVRSISEAAGVNISAITYHFGGKTQLFEEMFRRRVVPLNAERLALLDTALAQRSPVTLESVVRAFVEPPMRLTAAVDEASGNSAVVVMQFLGHAFAIPGESEFLGTYYEPVRSRFVLALKHVLPSVPLQDIIWGYNLMVGGIIYAMGGLERMERPPAAFEGMPLDYPHDLESLVGRMTRFFSAGLSHSAA